MRFVFHFSIYALLPSSFMWDFACTWNNLLPPLCQPSNPSSFKSILNSHCYFSPASDHFLTKQITKPEKGKSRHKICKCYSLFSLDTNSPAQHDPPFLFVSSLFKRMQVSRLCLWFSPFLFVSKNDQLVLISRFILASYQGFQLKDPEVKDFVVLYPC